MEQFRYRKDESKVLGAGEFSVDHDTARCIIYTGLYEGDTIVALLVATDEDAHQGSIDRIGNKLTRAMNSHYEMRNLLEEAARYLRHDPQTDLELVGRIEAKLADLTTNV